MPEKPDFPAPAAPSDFIRDIVAADVVAQRHAKIVTRFPPEPNGYLHIGHAKSICLNFGIAREQGGMCNLRFDDTNPAKEEVEYVESITTDVQWLIAGWADQCLGFKPKGAHPARTTVNGQPDYYLAPVEPPAPGATVPASIEPFFASDYFDQLYGYAVELIKRGKAYVCDLSAEDTEKYRGAPDRPGQDSPFRHRSVAENLDLFARMKAGEFPDGARSLRSKIDMTSPNMWLRDPLLYRIRHIPHYHAGDKWCVYPLYDYAHCLSDYLEGVSHSLCSLEFVPHRPLYDWVLENLGLPRPLPHQYEFAKLVPTYTILSKRNILRLVQEKVVSGWDDPRLPTLSGLRRRGVPASAVRKFVTSVGVTTFNSVTDIAVFEHAVREELNATAQRRLAVLKPIKLVLTNISAGESVACTATNNPQDETPTTRPLALTREVFIETDDFAEMPPPKYFRLKPGGEVRLKYACIIKCDELVKDASGAITEIRCTAQLDTRHGQPNADKKVKGTIHWVSATGCIAAEVRLYDRLFTVPEPAAEDDFLKVVNPKSLEVVTARLEPSLATAMPADLFQFERLGYFSLDKDSPGGPPLAGGPRLIFNRAISLKDTWATAASSSEVSKPAKPDRGREIESLVEKICTKMFLPDLTVANQKLLKGGKLEKELADVIIPYHDSLVCFQIKSKTELKPASQKTETDFARINRRVEDGINQLKTIQNALRDGLVSELLNRAGIALPIKPSSIQKIYGVVILELLGEEKFSPEEQTTIFNGFTIRDKMPVHVFALRDFDTISTEIDTVPDFIDYLEVRGTLISRGQLFPFTQELDFLALYKTKHNIFTELQSGEQTFLMIQEGLWKHHVETRKHIIDARNEANAPSYLFDETIKTLRNSIGFTAPSIPAGARSDIPQGSNANYYAAILELSTMRRIERRAAGQKWLDVLGRATQRPFAYSFVGTGDGRGVNLLLYSSNEPREKRTEALFNLCSFIYCGLNLKKLIGIATEPADKIERSHDLIVLDGVTFENADEIKTAFEKQNPQIKKMTVKEYGQFESGEAPPQNP